MLKFGGSLDDLKRIVMRCAIPGEWSFRKKNRFYRFQAGSGAILNWWPTTGTINFQGRTLISSRRASSNMLSPRRSIQNRG